MNKQKHIDYWLASAEKDVEVMQYLLAGKKYVQGLFFGHLYLEKLLKALWVKNNEENIAPKTHNLLKLLSEGNVKLEEGNEMFLLKLNLYQIEGRYPEDLEKLYAVTNKELADEYVLKINEIKKCLLEKLQ